MFRRDRDGGDFDSDIAHSPWPAEFRSIADCAAGVVFVKDICRLRIQAAGDGYSKGVGENDGCGC